MTSFVHNMLFAILWATIVGEVTGLNLLFGFALGYLALRIPPGRAARARYFEKFRQLLDFTVFFVREATLSALRVAYDVVTPTHHTRPAVLAVPLDTRTDTEVAVLANLISLTPGSLSLEATPDRSTLYVHFMFVDDPDETIAQVKRDFERRVLELLR
ncbi:Na+/H+ antiporter subunit E [Sandaracinus amylolyticus]|uniref:Na(+) H(+) antiporter subunit E n=1 Tax=Sandaracinus amylolyticus TaxID=927083 RepID=A0A0F6YKW8_9BACT|nr:Na+/H+ antiporter subunit E [Sandaracinus amylolyticus]AKF08651.1 Na(+) H(+) antiporter subunit E [Sandaracinus amylolyticus]